MERINGGGGTAQEVYREPWVAPGYEVLQTVVDKWAPLVLCSLRKGPKRYGELRRSIGGISQKMLTQTVRKLEQFGLVARRIEETTPPAVEYARRCSKRSAKSSTTSAKASLCAWRSEPGSRRQAGSTRKKV